MFFSLRLVDSTPLNFKAITDFPWSCAFDSEDICGFVHAQHSTLSWKFHSGETPTSNTGPSGDDVSSSYLLFDASQEVATSDGVARLVSPTFPDFSWFGKPFTYCLLLNLHMFGSDVGSFIVKDYDELILYSAQGGDL